MNITFKIKLFIGLVVSIATMVAAGTSVAAADTKPVVSTATATPEVGYWCIGIEIQCLPPMRLQ
ncbi:MAG: hypothetical protein E6G32_08260 [Actinobacteria bacterium]|nr:MAG: hypothetical protein E6G32_08260 [Actinomycetota bacterium]